MSDPEQPTPAADPATPPPGAEPDDANDLRGKHFRELLHSPLTWFWVLGASLLLGLVFVFTFSPVVGAIVFVGVFLIGLWVTFKVADSRAADDFFAVYSKQRGLTLGGKTALPFSTPLLRKGDDRYAKRTLTGDLAPSVGGFLALYTYVTESTDSKGNRTKDYHRFTLGITTIPECDSHAPELYCQRRSGLRALEGLENVLRSSRLSPPGEDNSPRGRSHQTLLTCPRCRQDNSANGRRIGARAHRAVWRRLASP